MNNITQFAPLMLRRARNPEQSRWRWAGPVSAICIAAVICWLAWTVVG